MQPVIQSMRAPRARVHLFARESDRDPFEYKGLVTPIREIDATPVEIIWRARMAADSASQPLAEEVSGLGYAEGAVRTINVDARERNPAARRACIEHWGTACSICGMSFGEFYGPIAEGFVHVHHLIPLSNAGDGREVDPIRDMRPVCPNCHGVIHLSDPPFTLDQVRAMLRPA